MSPVHLGCLALAVLAAAPIAHAQSPAPAASTSPAANKHKALAPAQINAIRFIGRNVLAAKKSAQDDPSDALQLNQLRSTVDQLLAAEFDQPRISLSGQSVGTEAAERRTAGHARVRALAAQLRERHGRSAAGIAQAAGDPETTSAGLPVGRQRAVVLTRMADKLQAAAGEDGTDRALRLSELQQQLRAAQGALQEAPLQAQTPTLQAMPAGAVPPARRTNPPSSANGRP